MVSFSLLPFSLWWAKTLWVLGLSAWRCLTLFRWELLPNVCNPHHGIPTWSPGAVTVSFFLIFFLRFCSVLSFMLSNLKENPTILQKHHLTEYDLICGFFEMTRKPKALAQAYPDPEPPAWIWTKLYLFMFQVTGILSWIVRSWTDVENNIVSVERVKEYADTPKEVSKDWTMWASSSVYIFIQFYTTGLLNSQFWWVGFIYLFFFILHQLWW